MTKSNRVRIHDDKERWGESSPKKKERWGESSPLEKERRGESSP